MFISDIFNRYQVKQIAKMNVVVIGMLNQGEFEQAKGAMAIAKAIIKLPATISTEDDVKQKATENMKRFQSNFIMEAVKG